MSAPSTRHGSATGGGMVVRAGGPGGGAGGAGGAGDVKPIRVWRVVLFFAVAAAVIGVAHVFDLGIAARLINPNATDADWGRMLRVAGYVPTWVLVSTAMVLIDRRRLRGGAPAVFPVRDMWSRGVLLLLSAAGSGLVAEGVKLVVRRGRPVLVDGHAEYVFRSFSEGTWSTSGLGMASSHSAVAFGAAFMLCRLHPAGTPVWLILAAGCAATRVLARAHFLSDVVAGAVLGYAVAWVLWRWHASNAARAGRAGNGGGAS